ncbi:vanadium-dependent haloperoxidase [Paludisphaera rhizosphaerae]|uniref:vanadium-dependent haloperoxidase n=1 Tax=Paludisphaera rhizosphaerae TaxID=2711216 RepID=UPI0013EB191F|nr:vanadium-dependent haloperoxidase [Paludisphaera rhizosphaerae]
MSQSHAASCTAILCCAFSATVFVASSIAQEQPRQEQTRADFSKYFELQKKVAEAPSAPLGARRMAAAAAVKAAPSKDAVRSRLLKAQEERTPQPSAMDFVANNPVLEEVSASGDPEFAQVVFWNEVALRITANDHTAPPPGSNLDTHPFEQVGPVRTSRALAIVHIAMFESINAVQRKFESYKNIQQKIFQTTSLPADIDASQVSIRHAIAQAAHRALTALYPGKTPDLNLTLAANLTAIQETPVRAINGLAIGDAAANAILDLRKLDGSEMPDPDVAGFQTTDPLKWQRDPLSLDVATALGANWRYVKPFVLEKADVFRPPLPPPVGDSRFVAAFKEVLEKGGDPAAGMTDPPGNADRRPTPTTRTDDETFIGKFWAYDGTALLCAPPRLYNMIATSLALREKKDTITTALDLARFLALVNVALADAGIAAWEAKFCYIYPRPITMIRAASPGMFPVDAPRPFWTPLGAPVSNGRAGRLNFSPPFPAYPSGHAVFGGALFQMFRKYWADPAGPAFTFVSDEFNGHNSDPGASQPRPLLPVTFPGFAKAEMDNAESRIFLGIHWRPDAEEGIIQGNKVADYVFDHVFKPL